ncbi:MAG TPA: hypothetical protein PKY87_18750 [Terricaulis sp.]|nr:hypothetical protein [Terricaulis sp.]
MTAKAKHRAWLFKQQGRCCYLQITSGCRDAGGVMTIASHHTERFATIEHLKPRTRKGEQRFVLLACAECNKAKGDAPIATDEQFAYAENLANVWMRISSGLNDGDAFARAGAPWFAREGVKVFAQPLPITDGLPIDSTPRQLKQLMKYRAMRAA